MYILGPSYTEKKGCKCESKLVAAGMPVNYCEMYDKPHENLFTVQSLDALQKKWQLKMNAGSILC